MNDQIKDFVDKNREEFDQLEAPAFDMQRFKQKTLLQAETDVKIIPLYKKTKWLVAAAVLMAMGITWVIFSQQNGEKQLQVSASKDNIIKIDPPVPVLSDSLNNRIETRKVALQIPLANTKVPSKRTHIQGKVVVASYKGLSDSSSASRRLLAILEIEKSKQINTETMDMLSKTLNQDGNTNVRLAALSVLQKHSTDGHASSILVSALGKQDDPIVQLGLINLLGKMKNVKIEDKLRALVENPQTFAAVRDEAYSLLLNQDKL